MSELARAMQGADAMEDALAAPLFDGVRADVDAVLDGEHLGVEMVFRRAETADRNYWEAQFRHGLKLLDAERARAEVLQTERDDARAELAATEKNTNGAIAAELERLAMDRDSGGQCYMAKILYREFPDRLHESVGVVHGATLLRRAGELRAIAATKGGA